MNYSFDKEIDRLGTGCIKWDLLGKDYLPLWVADMDFAVAPAVMERLNRRMQHPVFGYYEPTEELFEAIIGWFDRMYQVTIPDKEWIRMVPAIVPALAVASNIGGGKSITTIPNYCALLEAPETAGNVMIKVPLKEEKDFFSIDFEGLQAAMTEDTKIFYLCNPNNPVGRVFTREELQAVSDFARKNDLIVISDEAHCELVFEGEHIPFFTVDEYAREHSITMYSNGKMCNLPDLITAFAIIPNEELRKAFNKEAYAIGSVHNLNMEAGIATYSECDEWKKELRAYLKENRDYLESELRRRFPKAKLPHLQSTYLQWVDFTPYGEAVNNTFFKEKAHVFFTDGDRFGVDNRVRINFGTQRSILTKALDRMEKAMEEQGVL